MEHPAPEFHEVAVAKAGVTVVGPADPSDLVIAEISSPADPLLGCGYPRGPLELLDEIGAGPVRAALAAMYEAGGDPALAPPPLLAEHAAAGLGFRR